MKAITFEGYGGPEILKLAEVERPIPKDDEVLIRVRAASVNSWDWDLVRGEPFFVRLTVKGQRRLGFDVAGVVEAVGAKVTRFKPGEEIYGDICDGGIGSLAEYVCGPERLLSHKPKTMSFEQAAALPQAGVLALEGMREVAAGMRVLVNGAGGGVGTFAIQLARHAGAEVTAVDSAEKFEVMRAAGATSVIDYRSADWAQLSARYDLILEVIGQRPLAAYAAALNPGGRMRLVGGKMGLIASTFFFGGTVGRSGNKNLALVIHRPSTALLDELAGLFAAGTITPVIDRVFPRAEAAAAVKVIADGEAKGKIVVRVD